MSLPDLTSQPSAPAFPEPLRSVHLIGISGSGMYPLAQALLDSGVAVSGSDLDAAKAESLRERGARLYTGHAAENLDSPQAVVISTAIPETNPELAAARARGIPVFHRSEMLGWFLERRESVLIAGTHGKTTTTTLAGLLLEAAGTNPWCFVGGRVEEFRGNYRHGGNGFAVAEADESDGSFLNLPRHHLLVTNLEAEHLNYWGDLESIEKGFLELIAELPPTGNLVICTDDPGLQRLRQRIRHPIIGYGLTPDAEFHARELVLSGETTRFELYKQSERLCTVELGIPGRHNAMNAVGAYALAASLGVDLRPLGKALATFRGVDRRFTKRDAPQGYLVIDDYAHHPTEIAATVDAARCLAHERGGRLIAVFQPHRYTRIASFFTRFDTCFAGLDKLIMLDIYSGGEEPITGITGERLYREVTRHYSFTAEYRPELEEAQKRLHEMLKVGDIVLLLGAGSVTKLAPLLAKHAET